MLRRQHLQLSSTCWNRGNFAVPVHPPGQVALLGNTFPTRLAAIGLLVPMHAIIWGFARYHTTGSTICRRIYGPGCMMAGLGRSLLWASLGCPGADLIDLMGMSGTIAVGAGDSQPSVPGTPNASLSHLPWTMTPSFRPGETDINEYTKKLEFLASLWPPEHLSHLAPRAAMLCEGSSFKRVMRLDAAKLKVNSTDGVRLLVTTLGGIWGKSNLEEKFERFERAIYTTVQRTDESHDSYLARHDFQFEELLQMGVRFEDIRAYILLRNSGLGSDDKKRLIVESQGSLEYKSIVSALKLLGSKFFHEVQSGSKFPNRVKTYDVNAVFDDEPAPSYQEDDHAFMGEAWDDPEVYLDETDPDAIVCMQFEESLLEAMQSDSDLAACYNTYLDARKRITDKNRNRGFWGNSKGYGANKGKGKSKGKFSMRFRKPLAQRILESECRRCGAKGHWKAECPLNRTNSAASNPSAAPNTGAFTGAVLPGNEHAVEDDMILLSEARGLSKTIAMNDTPLVNMVCPVSSKSVSPSPLALSRFVSSLKSRLSPQRPMYRVPQSVQSAVVRPDVTADVNFVSHGPYGIVDLGASQTVIGQQQVEELLQCLPKDVVRRSQRVPCDTVFRFGNSSTVVCQQALLVPLAQWSVKICIVKSQTPFLISNNVFRTLGAQIDTAQDSVFFSKIDVHMPLKLSEKKLYLLDFCELVKRSQQANTPQIKTNEHVHMPVMNVQIESPITDQLQSQGEVSITKVTEVSASECTTSDQQSAFANQAEKPADPRSLSVPVSCHHGDTIVGRSLSSRAESEEDGRVPGHVVCRSLPDAHRLWRNESQPDLPGGDRERPKVCAVVRQEVPQQSEGSPSVLSVLPESVCGAQGIGEGRPAACEDDPASDAEVQSEGQAHTPCPIRSWESGIMVRRWDNSVGCDARGASDATASPRGDGGEPPPDQQHGECTGADFSATPSLDPGDSGSQSEPVDAGGHVDILRTLMCDDIGESMLETNPEIVVDASYFQEPTCALQEQTNWVDVEMWQYFHNKYPHYSLRDLEHHFSHCRIDVLEVYCSESSQLTHQCQALGLSAVRFGLKQGDLATFAGRTKLYDLIWMVRPRHIWTSPKCGPWCAWSRLNMNKSLQLEAQILADRQAENVHLCLCDALYRLQIWRGTVYHFHLEQPLGSELIFQNEMAGIVQNTLKAVCDMCTAGHLKHPETHDFLKKRTQILTTSRILWRTLEQFQCLGTHTHDIVAGSYKSPMRGRIPVSQYTEMYTAVFGRRVARAFQCSIQVKERAVNDAEILASLTQCAYTSESLTEDLPEPKRRRLFGKFSPEQFYLPSSSSPETPEPTSASPTVDDPDHQLKQVIQLAEQCAPRVGKVILQEGPLFQQIQALYPEKQIVVLDVCRGINRMRVCPIGPKGIAPFRRVIGKRRSDLSVFADTAWEQWEELSHRQQIRAGTPSRILITVFATNKRVNAPASEPEPETKRPRVDVGDDHQNAVPATSEHVPHGTQGSVSTEVQEETIPSEQGKTSTCHTHGPRFKALKAEIQAQIKKVHQNLGHPDNRVLQLALKRAGWPEQDIQGCADFVCPSCFERKQPKISRPSHLHAARDFNDLVSFDGAEWTDPSGKSYSFFHFIDAATNFHTAISYQQRTTESLIHSFNTAWVRWAGPPKKMMFDSATESNSEEFARYLQEQAIKSYVIPTEAHWQLGRAERHGSILKHMIDQYHADMPIRNADDFEQCLIHLCNAKNSMSRHEGYTPELWVLGKMKPLPGNNISSPMDSASFAGLDVDTTEGEKFAAQLARRETARLAFVKADHSASLRRALHARSRPDRMQFTVGDFVMYWREGKGVEEGSWKGPARVLMIENHNLVWLSHLTRLYRCAPEHVRLLSEDEAKSLSSADVQMFNLPDRCGSGVFQFKELSGQRTPPSVRQDAPSIFRSPEHDTVILPQQPVNESSGISNENPHQPSSVGQPDDEPDNVEVPANSSNAPDGIDFNGPVEMPVPTDDELTGQYISGSSFERHETWRNEVTAHNIAPEPWVGTTVFSYKSPISKNVNQTSQTPALQQIHQKPQAHQYEIFLTLDEMQKCLGRTYESQEAFLASAAKRQKVEVKVRDLTTEELDLFRKAKEKEIDSWLSTDTVRRILRHQVPEGQLLRSRWVLTWKALDEIEQQEVGASRKAKARLVVLGYEDPLIDSLPRDSPTLGKDSRMLALQCIASHRWSAKSFDIRTAFLRGSRQESRILGVEPPPELRLRMKLKDDEVCSLLKGAYGLVNAPLLWYGELKNALLGLGFVISPLDPCVFVLPKQKTTSPEETQIHGILGVHVDDGLGGGDHVYQQAIKRLEQRFPFGSQRQGSFTFTGINLVQDHNGDITLNQREYINDIPPINVPRERRKTLEAKVTNQELQDLRGLIGSLQYAASNTRPDLSCRLSLLQARITCATVSDLLQGNRLLADAKRTSDTNIRIQSLEPQKVRFMSFSDAAFATREKAHSQKGCLILATTDEISETRSAPVSPLIWFSKKINRVVSSTLASETFALSGALDLLSWTRMHWSWMLNPSVAWKTPEVTLKHLPPAYAVVDCKSLFDLLQKTSIPQCTEHRTTLEALVIKERLQEGVSVKWVHSAAQMADALTKDMDTTVLRSFLRNGRCVLHDAEEILKQRADKKIRQQWYEQTSAEKSALHAFALAVLTVA
eukprot:s5467_g2.t1